MRRNVGYVIICIRLSPGAADFAACLTLYHGLELLTQHGMRPFYTFFNKVTQPSQASSHVLPIIGICSRLVWASQVQGLYFGPKTLSPRSFRKITLPLVS